MERVTRKRVVVFHQPIRSAHDDKPGPFQNVLQSGDPADIGSIVARVSCQTTQRRD